jgi:phage terminase small subunit
MPRTLTERQRRFVDAYLVSRNATQAAYDSGYSRQRRCTGSALLQRPWIIAALRARGLDPPRGIHPATQIRQRRRAAGLNPLEERFALAYLVTGNASEAARRAGLKGNLPNVSGPKMLLRPHVAAFVAAEREASVARTRIDIDRVRREYARLAFVDIGDIIEWDEEGNFVLKASADIAPDDRAAIAQIKVKRGKASIKLQDKQRALDSLARLMGLFGKKNFVTIDHVRERRDANAILRERLLKIANQGEVKGAGETK